MQTILQTRQAHRSDLPILAQMWYQKMILLAQFDRQITLKPIAERQWLDQAEEWLHNEKVEMFIALHKEDRLGYIVGSEHLNLLDGEYRKQAIVIELVTELHTRQGGIGKQLLNSFKIWCQERQIIEIIVTASRHYAVEQAFWLSVGHEIASDTFKVLV